MVSIYKNILLISGTGRNVGKTLFASQVIANLAEKIPIVAIKISPHLHQIKPDAHIIEQAHNYSITKEVSVDGNKDSQRFLKAGAKSVYYLQCMDNELPMVFKKLMKQLPKNTPIICESGALRQILKPGTFLMITKKNNKQLKPKALISGELADKWIEFNDHKFNFNPQNLHISESGWTIQT